MRTHSSTTGRNTRFVYLLLLAMALSAAGSWQPGLAQKAAHPPAGTMAAGDAFGFSVALSDDRAVVGATYSDNNVVDAGSVYVFERQADATWRKVADLHASDGVPGDEFGQAVALSGPYAIIGAPFKLDASRHVNIGAAYVFERLPDGTWREAARLEGDGTNENLFGDALALSGTRALVMSHDSRYSEVRTDTGSVYVFDRQPDGTWIRTAKFTTSTTMEFSGLDNSVALLGDRALVGIPVENVARGAVYAFDRQPDGTWIRTARLSASNGAELDWFGNSVTLFGDRALIGASGDDEAGSEAGAAYVFDWQPDGTWTRTAKLTAGTDDGVNSFGRSSALAGDRALVGAIQYQYDLGENRGVAYVFDRQSDGTWVRSARLVTDDVQEPGPHGSWDWFGHSIALSGERALVGAFIHTNDGLIGEGAAYVYERQAEGTWIETAKLTPDSVAAVLNFTLVDQDTGQPIPGFDPIPDGATLDLQVLPPRLNVRANTTDFTRSVRFTFLGKFAYHTEYEPPYLLFGKAPTYPPGRLPLGTHTLKATPYAQNDGYGKSGYPLEITVHVVEGGIGPIGINRLVLVDADTGLDLFDLGFYSATLDLDQLPPRLNVRADVYGPVQSVRFKIEPQGYGRTENAAPYALFGDSNGRFFGGTFVPEMRVLRVTPYIRPHSQGVPGMTWEVWLGVRGTPAAKASVLVGEYEEGVHEAPGANDQAAVMPTHYALEANYPNPFNPTTVIAFSLPEAAPVHIAVYDLLGRQVALLVDAPLPAGHHEVTFDGTGLPSGLYLYRLQAPGQTFVRRMHLLK